MKDIVESSLKSTLYLTISLLLVGIVIYSDTFVMPRTISSAFPFAITLSLTLPSLPIEIILSTAFDTVKFPRASAPRRAF